MSLIGTMAPATRSALSATPDTDADASSPTSPRTTAQPTALTDRLAIAAQIEDLYRRFHDEVRDYLLHLVQEAPLADDLAQQVFLHALAARRPIITGPSRSLETPAACPHPQPLPHGGRGAQSRKTTGQPDLLLLL